MLQSLGLFSVRGKATVTRLTLPSELRPWRSRAAGCLRPGRQNPGRAMALAAHYVDRSRQRRMNETFIPRASRLKSSAPRLDCMVRKQRANLPSGGLTQGQCRVLLVVYKCAHCCWDRHVCLESGAIKTSREKGAYVSPICASRRKPSRMRTRRPSGRQLVANTYLNNTYVFK
jgi:hypothetical protein